MYLHKSISTTKTDLVTINGVLKKPKSDLRILEYLFLMLTHYFLWFANSTPFPSRLFNILIYSIFDSFHPSTHSLNIIKIYYYFNLILRVYKNCVFIFHLVFMCVRIRNWKKFYIHLHRVLYFINVMGFKKVTLHNCRTASDIENNWAVLTIDTNFVWAPNQENILLIDFFFFKLFIQICIHFCV